MPKLVSIRPAYKILTSNYSSRTLLFFASYADFFLKKKMKGEQMMMTNEKMKINGCTPIEDLITEDFGAIGPPERDEFERGCEAFIIWDEK